MRMSWAEHYAAHVVPRLLAAPAELLLDALPAIDPGARVLEVGAGAGPLSRALAERLQGMARFVALEEDQGLAAMLPDVRGTAARLVASPDRLPVRPGTFDVALGNLVVLDAVEDERRLGELRRALRPSGWLLTTVLLRGSFDELFDIFVEVCEGADLHAARGALADTRRNFLDEDGARALLHDAGFQHVHTGVEERALFFKSGADVVEDPLVKDVLLASWLRGAPPLTAAALKSAARAIDTYFAGGRFAVRVKTAVLLARARAGA